MKMRKRYLGIGILITISLAVYGCGSSSETEENAKATYAAENEVEDEIFENEESEIRAYIQKYVADGEKKAAKKLSKKDEMYVKTILEDEALQYLLEIENWSSADDAVIRSYYELYQELYDDNEWDGILESADKLQALSSAGGDDKVQIGTLRLDWNYVAENMQQGNLYITKRLETRYDDTVAGAVQKELDHLEQSEESEWIACSVEYLLGTEIPGDTAAVLRADYQNPFSESGVYNVNYVVLNETETLIDGGGFTQEVPVYYMISDVQAFYEGYEAFQTKKNLLDAEIGKIMDTIASNTADAEAVESVSIVDESEYMIPYSNTQYLTEKDVAELSNDEIRIAINEIYARHGRKYETEDLNAYFSSKSWYEPKYSAEEFSEIEDSVLNDYEKKNIEILAAVRDGNDAVVSTFEENWMYGSYYLDLGEGGITAEIGFYTDTGVDYISLSGSYMDSIGEFTGTITYMDDGSMLASNEYDETVYFEYNGIDQIEIVFADNTGGMDFPGFEGIYQKTEDLPRQ